MELPNSRPMRTLAKTMAMICAPEIAAVSFVGQAFVSFPSCDG